MLENHFKKINQTFIIKTFVLLFLSGIIVVNIKVIVDNLVSSLGIDETIVSEANPRLNKKLIQEATTTLESFSSQELTSISTSVTLEQGSANSGVEEPSNISIEIQNASGITGAASEIAEKLALQGYQISAISTAPSLQGSTKVFYKPGKAADAQTILQIIQDENWLVESSQEAEAEQQVDILIVLGK